MNKLYFFIFTLFLIPFIVYAQGEVAHSDAEELYNETQLEPIENSPYTAEFFAVTKNNDGDLVSVISGYVYAYLPYQIFENQLNKFPRSFITIDGTDYKKWNVWTYKIHENEKPIHGSELKAPIFTNDEIVILRINHASIVVEENDTTDYFITVLKRLN